MRQTFPQASLMYIPPEMMTLSKDDVSDLLQTCVKFHTINAVVRAICPGRLQKCRIIPFQAARYVTVDLYQLLRR